MSEANNLRKAYLDAQRTAEIWRAKTLAAFNAAADIEADTPITAGGDSADARSTITTLRNLLDALAPSPDSGGEVVTAAVLLERLAEERDEARAALTEVLKYSEIGQIPSRVFNAARAALSPNRPG